MFRITLAMIALVACSVGNLARADQDLDTLLGELTFGDSNQTDTSVLVPEIPQADELAPVPQQRFTNARETASDQMIESDSRTPVATNANQIPQPIQPNTIGESPINFNQYFDAGGRRDECVGGSGAPPCDTQVACRPHRAPNLPPPSTTLQYFQSDNCYSDIWSGFAAERQQRCAEMHKCIHGNCDCFTKGKSHCGCDRTASKCDGNSSYR